MTRDYDGISFSAIDEIEMFHDRIEAKARGGTMQHAAAVDAALAAAHLGRPRAVLLFNDVRTEVPAATAAFVSHRVKELSDARRRVTERAEDAVQRLDAEILGLRAIEARLVLAEHKDTLPQWYEAWRAYHAVETTEHPCSWMGCMRPCRPEGEETCDRHILARPRRRTTE